MRREERKQDVASAIQWAGDEIALLFWGLPRCKKPPTREQIEPILQKLYKLHRRYVRIRA